MDTVPLTDREEVVFLDRYPINPSVNYSLNPVLVDGNLITECAVLVGTYSYIDTAGGRRTIKKYDFGEIWTKPLTELPEDRVRIGANGRQIDSVASSALKAEREGLSKTESEKKAKRQSQTDTRLLDFQRKRAKEGSAQAQYDIGIRYLNGVGVERDRPLAIEFLKKAADQGFKRASETLKSLTD